VIQPKQIFPLRDSQIGYNKLVRLWFRQEGICPQCDHKITRETGWHLHHQVWAVNGGDDSFANLVLMHPTCHQQLHAQINQANDPECYAASAPNGV
jgi:RNA-directed DNA polymerase